MPNREVLPSAMLHRCLGRRPPDKHKIGMLAFKGVDHRPSPAPLLLESLSPSFRGESLGRTGQGVAQHSRSTPPNAHST